MTPVPHSRDPQPVGAQFGDPQPGTQPGTRPATRPGAPPGAQHDAWPRLAAADVRAALQDYVSAGGAPGAVVVLGDTTADTVDGTVADTVDGTAGGAAGARVRTEAVEVGLVGAECGPAPASADTLYDVASVTKMLAVWPLAGFAIRDHGLDPDAPVERYLALPGPSERWPSAQVSTGQVLAHVSGLLRRTRLDLYRERARPLVEQICAEDLERQVGEYRYLSRGYILLGLLLSRLFGRDLGQAAAELVWRPAGMSATSYGPVPRGSQVAPTERYFPDAPRIWGQAHDDAARLLGGIAGHAGAFAATADLAAYAGWLLSPHSPLADWLRESLRPVVPVTVSEPESEGAPVGRGLMRGLGWMLTDGGVAYHDGFTGPSLYLRPDPTGVGGRFLALGTNAVYAGRARPGLRKLRQLLLDAIERPSAA